MGTPINTTDTPVPVSNLLDMPTLDNVSNMPPTHPVNVKDTVINCTIDENAITESTLWIESNTYLAGADGHTITFARNPNAKDPTYDELINFIQNDTTDQHPYVDGQYVCADYAEDVQHNAEAAGYKCGYVVINFIDGPGHACNAFNTVDDGLVYIDCTPHVGPVMGGNTDYYAHIQDGEAYNSYPISGHEEGDTSPMGIVKSHKIYWG
jgi:hypothetical protein